LFFPETTFCKGLFKEHSRQVCVPMVRIMLFNATFNNMSVISWRSMLLVEETEYPQFVKYFPHGPMQIICTVLEHIILDISQSESIMALSVMLKFRMTRKSY
jgi:hypothetical protein